MVSEMWSRALLFDIYGGLLTEKQRNVCDLRYNEDLSLGEIAELEGITRQAVRDNLLRAEAQMQSLEETLGLLARADRLRQAASLLETAAGQAAQLGPGAQELMETIDRAKALIKE